MRTAATLLLSATAALLSACHTTMPQDPATLAAAKPAPVTSVYRDMTAVAPSWEYSETTQSKYVIVGSQTFAMAAGCQFLQRYAVRTNADFGSTLNLLKNRSALMGANWVTIASHSEVDLLEHPGYQLQNHIILREGTVTQENRFLTELIGDLYDCPCGTTACAPQASN